MNALLEQLKNGIVGEINKVSLPPGCVYYVLKDIFRDIEQIYFKTVEQEISNPEQYESKEVVAENIFDEMMDIQPDNNDTNENINMIIDREKGGE